LYGSVTADLIKRVWQHKNDLVEGFAEEYGEPWLLWYEMHETMAKAILRETALKNWHRAQRYESLRNVIRHG
jgi:putative endonuclease